MNKIATRIGVIALGALALAGCSHRTIESVRLDTLAPQGARQCSTLPEGGR